MPDALVRVAHEGSITAMHSVIA